MDILLVWMDNFVFVFGWGSQNLHVGLQLPNLEYQVCICYPVFRLNSSPNYHMASFGLAFFFGIFLKNFTVAEFLEYILKYF